jgi:hypothetical protein
MGAYKMTLDENVNSTAAFSTNVVSIRKEQAGKRNLSDRPYAWKERVVQRLEYLIRLERGWDGYNARNVQFPIAVFAISMLDSICGPSTKAPDIVPGADGDLQIEWHTLNGDIELDVRAPNVVVAWRSTENPDGEEITLKNNFSVISGWVADLMEPTVAHNAAA